MTHNILTSILIRFHSQQVKSMPFLNWKSFFLGCYANSNSHWVIRVVRQLAHLARLYSNLSTGFIWPSNREKLAQLPLDNFLKQKIYSITNSTKSINNVCKQRAISNLPREVIYTTGNRQQQKSPLTFNKYPYNNEFLMTFILKYNFKCNNNVNKIELALPLMTCIRSSYFV
jgi:hypothetical protein